MLIFRFQLKASQIRGRIIIIIIIIIITNIKG